MISSLAAALAVLTFVSLTTWRNRMKWSPTAWIMCASSMTVRMQQPFQSNRPMHIYSWAATMLQVKPKIITTSLGWLTMLRKTTAFRPYSKILQLSSTEKVLVQFHFSVSIDYFSPYVHCYLSHFFSKEYGMQKAVEGKLVQNEQLCTVLKLILLLTFTTSWSSITLLSQTHITKRSIKWIKESSTTSHVERSWLFILEGKQTSYQVLSSAFILKICIGSF